jgi:hypothetical protein
MNSINCDCLSSLAASQKKQYVNLKFTNEVVCRGTNSTTIIASKVERIVLAEKSYGGGGCCKEDIDG